MISSDAFYLALESSLAPFEMPDIVDQEPRIRRFGRIILMEDNVVQVEVFWQTEAVLAFSGHSVNVDCFVDDGETHIFTNEWKEFNELRETDTGHVFSYLRGLDATEPWFVSWRDSVMRTQTAEEKKAMIDFRNTISPKELSDCKKHAKEVSRWRETAVKSQRKGSTIWNPYMFHEFALDCYGEALVTVEWRPIEKATLHWTQKVTEAIVWTPSLEPLAHFIGYEECTDHIKDSEGDVTLNSGVIRAAVNVAHKPLTTTTTTMTLTMSTTTTTTSSSKDFMFRIGDKVTVKHYGQTGDGIVQFPFLVKGEKRYQIKMCIGSQQEVPIEYVYSREVPTKRRRICYSDL